MSRVIEEKEFRQRLSEILKRYGFERKAKSVTGPGRSGAVASVYASHMLGIPWIPFGTPCPDKLRPLMIIDTAIKTGKTLKRAMAEYGEPCVLIAAFDEPPRVRFWYEIKETS